MEVITLQQSNKLMEWLEVDSHIGVQIVVMKIIIFLRLMNENAKIRKNEEI